MRKTYAEKLQDPRWQKKRLEVLNRDNFTCQKCGDTTTTLHVHHESYKGNPWEVDSSELTTVCKNCHANEHAVQTPLSGVALSYKDLCKIAQYGTATHDEQGRLKYHIDNPDYPPIYKNDGSGEKNIQYW